MHLIPWQGAKLDSRMHVTWQVQLWDEDGKEGELSEKAEFEIVEAVERSDKDFALGIQFHPEAAVVRHLDDSPEANRFMSLSEGLDFFRVLVEHCRNRKTK